MYQSQRGGFWGRNLYVGHNNGFDTFSVDDIKQGIGTSTFKGVCSTGYDCWSFACDDKGNMAFTCNYSSSPLYVSNDGGNTWYTLRTGGPGYVRWVHDDIFFVRPGNDDDKEGLIHYWRTNNTSTYYHANWYLPDGTQPNAIVDNSWYCNGYYFTSVGGKMYRGTSFYRATNELQYSGNSSYKFNQLGCFCYCYNKYWAVSASTSNGTGEVCDGGSSAGGAHLYYSNDGLTWYNASIENLERRPARIMVVNHKLYIQTVGWGNKHLHMGLITSDLKFVGTKLTSAELSENVYGFEVGFFASKMKGNE